MKIEKTKEGVLINSKLFRIRNTTKEDSLKYEYDTLLPAAADTEDVVAFDFKLQPGGRSPVYLVLDNKAHIEDTVVQGKGELVRYDRKNGLRILKVNNQNIGQAIIYHKDEFLVWIADKDEGLEVIGFNSPSDVENQEKDFAIEDPGLPKELKSYLIKK